MQIGIDALLAILWILVIIVGQRKGFVWSVIRTVGTFFAMVFSVTIGRLVTLPDGRPIGAVVAFAVLEILVIIIAKLLNRLVAAGRITGFFNRLLGGLLGGIKGLILGYFLILAWVILLRYAGDYLPEILRSGLENSFVFQFYTSFSLFS